MLGVEKHLVGGECPYYGCIPSKMMIRAADALAEARRVPELGGSVEVTPDWSTVAKRISDEATDAWNDQVAVDRLVGNGARFARGPAGWPGRGKVVVDTADGTEEYDVRRGVVLNVGTSPAVPPVEGLADTPYWTNRDVVQVTDLPDRMIVLGGGAIGCEIAQAFARFGVDVTILEVADRILGPEEPEASAVVAEAMAAEGIGVRDRRGDRAGRARSRLRVHGLPAAASSSPRPRCWWRPGAVRTSSDLGLDTVGLDPNARFLDTDEQVRAADGLWAVGDITGKGLFTHMSMYQAEVAVRSILGKDGPWADYTAVSRATFTDPEVGSVGLTEAQAREAGIRVTTGSYRAAELEPGLDAQDGQPRRHQGRRRRRPRRPGRRYDGRPVRRRDDRLDRDRRPRRGAGREAPHHALRLPDVLAGDRERHQRVTLTSDPLFHPRLRG